MEEPTADPTQVNDLVGMGFSTEAAGAALAATNQDFNQVRKREREFERERERERERESRERQESVESAERAEITDGGEREQRE